MTQIILASSSAARLAALRSAGLEPKVVVSNVDESLYSAPTTAELVNVLAGAKAETVAATVTAGIVIGCDSMLDLDGVALGKPGSAAEAARRWSQMSGRVGTLVTGHCLINAATGQRVTGAASTRVRFGRPTPEEIEAYVASGEPLHVAGGFTIDGRGGWFVDGLDGDHGNVLGISLPLVRRLLAELGISVTDLWT